MAIIIIITFTYAAFLKAGNYSLNILNVNLLHSRQHFQIGNLLLYPCFTAAFNNISVIFLELAFKEIHLEPKGGNAALSNVTARRQYT